MDLYLVPSHLGNFQLVSINGTTHYQVTTLKPEPENERRVTLIQRPIASTESAEESIVAEIDWKHGEYPAVIRSRTIHGFPVGRRIGSGRLGVRVDKFLHKRKGLGSFVRSNSDTRYFVGDDGCEYRWKNLKGGVRTLTCTNTNTETATFLETMSTEGAFAGEKRGVLRIQPCLSLDIDFIILTFVAMEMKRWKRAGLGVSVPEYDGEPAGDGGGDEGNADGGLLAEMGEV